MEYMVGQRVIYDNVICVVCVPESSNHSDWIWIYNPERGYKHGAAAYNIKPLPLGQL